MHALTIDSIPYGNGIGNSHSIALCDPRLDLITCEKKYLVPVTRQRVDIFSSNWIYEISIINYIAWY